MDLRGSAARTTCQVVQTYSHGCAKSIAGRGTFQTGKLSASFAGKERRLSLASFPHGLLVSCAFTLALAYHVAADRKSVV